MIIVDDRLSLDALAGQHARFGATADDVVATTWGFHYRLARALTDTSRVGALSGDVPAREVLDAVLSPPPDRLQVIDPRELTGAAAAAAVRHGLNLLAAELVAAAVHHHAVIALSSANVGRSWPAAFEAEGIELRVVA
ncbi:MAG: hypothetical protein ACT4OV_03255 [Microthrixaceae bacterium]